MKEFKPIVEEVKLGPMTVRHRLPPKGGLATVVEARDGYKKYEPHDPPKIGDLIAAGGYKRLYRVDISPYSVALKFDLPSRGDTWQFHASAILTVSVSDPATVVRLRMADGSVVESLIMRELRKRSRAFDITDIEQAEEALNDYLQDQEFPELGFKIKYGWISLGVDESEVKHRQQAGQLLRDKDRAAGRAELERQQAEFAAERNQYEAEHRQMLDRLHAEHEIQLERIQNQSRLELERVREAHRRELEKQRIAVYKEAVQMDIPGLLVLRLATHPEDADTVIQILAAEEEKAGCPPAVLPADAGQGGGRPRLAARGAGPEDASTAGRGVHAQQRAGRHRPDVRTADHRRARGRGRGHPHGAEGERRTARSLRRNREPGP